MTTLRNTPAQWNPAISGFKLLRTATAVLAIAGLLFTITYRLFADVPKTVAENNADPAAMIEAYRHVEALLSQTRSSNSSI
jgi:hypothetical protein